jgi:hypothetical protein
MTDLSTLGLDDLDARLVAARRASLEAWPYSGMNATVRAIEAEYRRRGEPLPELRPKEEA